MTNKNKQICNIPALNIYPMQWSNIGVRMCTSINEIDCLQKQYHFRCFTIGKRHGIMFKQDDKQPYTKPIFVHKGITKIHVVHLLNAALSFN